MPRVSFLGLGFLAGGYTAVAAIAYWVMDNFREVLLGNWEYVVCYVVAAGLISFAVIYRWGGVSNPRTFDLIQWSMQLLGLTLVFLSTPSSELSHGIVSGWWEVSHWVVG